MTREVSIGAKVAQISGLVGTKDASVWEQEFIADMVSLTDSGKITVALSDKQLDVIDRIWRRHFSG